MPILSRFSITIPFENAIDLTAYDITDMTTGVIAVVNTLDALFRYDRLSTAVPNNTTVINANGGVGRWLRMDTPLIQPAETNHLANFIDTTGALQNTTLIYEDAAAPFGGKRFSADEDKFTIIPAGMDPNDTNNLALLTFNRSSQRIDMYATNTISLAALGTDPLGDLLLTASNQTIISGGDLGVIIDGSFPTDGAALTIDSTERGFANASMTTVQKEAITPVGEGLSVYDNTLHAPSFYNGSLWVSPFNAQQEMNEPTGFPNSDDAIITIDDGTRTLTMTPASGDFYFFVNAIRFTKDSAENIIFSDTEGYHYFYYNDSGTLSIAVNPTEVEIEQLIRLSATVAIIYWDAVNKEHVYFTGQNELHGLQMDGSTHAYLHFTQGTKFLSGAALNTLSVDDVTPTDASAQFGVDIGFGLDEDRAFTGNPVASTVGLPVYYQEGSPGVPRRAYNPGFSILVGGTGLPVFNEDVGGTLQLTEITSGNYMWLHVFLTNNSPEGYICALGAQEYSNLGVARDAVTDDVSLVLGRGSGLVENKIVGSVLIEGKNSFTNAVKARVVSTNNGDYEDWRFENITSTVAPTEHDSLAGLPASFSHPQYVRANATISDTSVLGGLAQYEDTNGTVGASKLRVSSSIAGIVGETILPIDTSRNMAIACENDKTLSFGSPSDFFRQPEYISMYAANITMLSTAGGQVRVPLPVSMLGHLEIDSLTDGTEETSLKINNDFEFSNNILGKQLDIRNETITTSSVSGSVFSMIWYGNFLIAKVIGAPNSILVQNYENPLSPTTVASLTDASFSFGTKSTDIAVNGSTLFVCNEGNNTLSVIDITNIGDLSIIYTIADGDLSSPGAIYSIDKYIYVFNNTFELVVYDVSDVNNITKVKVINISARPEITLEVRGDYAYVVGLEGRLTVLNIIDPANPSVETSVTLSIDMKSIALAGKYAYAVSPNRLYTVDISNASSISITNTEIDATNLINMQSIVYVNNLLYIAQAGTGASTYKIMSYDVSDPSSPVKLGEIQTTYQPFSILPYGKYLIAAGSSAFTTFDLVGSSVPSASIGSAYIDELRSDNTNIQEGNITGSLKVGRNITASQMNCDKLRVGPSAITSSFEALIQSDNERMLSLEDTVNGIGGKLRSNLGSFSITSYSDLTSAYSDIRLNTGTTNFTLDSTADRATFSGNINAPSLPTSSPAIANDIWVDTTAGNVLRRGTGGAPATTIKGGLSKNSTQSIGNNVDTAITNWTATEFSNGLTVDQAGGVITIPTGADGLYFCSGTVYFAAGGNVDDRIATFRVNSGTIDYGKAGYTSNADVTCNPGSFIQLVAGDFVRLVVFQQSGGVLNISGGANYQRCEFQMVRIGD